MDRRGTLTRSLLLSVVLLGSSCSTSASERSFAEPEVRATRKANASSPVSQGTPGGSCPVTIANGSTPPGEAKSAQNHGNGKLWTVLWPHGVMLVDSGSMAPDGWIGMKVPWWAKGVKGDLKIEGRRLDGSAPLVRVSGPDESLRNEFSTGRFWSSGVFFQSEGCWEVTGRIGATSLTFVTIVLRGA